MVVYALTLSKIGHDIQPGVVVGVKTNFNSVYFLRVAVVLPEKLHVGVVQIGKVVIGHGVFDVDEQRLQRDVLNITGVVIGYRGVVKGRVVECEIVR